MAAATDSKQITPEVTWAQRSSKTDAAKNHVYLTISVPDVKPSNFKLDIQPTFVDFSGYSESKKATYKVKLELFDEIVPAESKVHHTARDVELVLRKKTLKEEYWPRLLKDKVKMHFLKTNFDKWVDEDEQNEVEETDDYMSRMGGMPGMEGMGGMGGMAGMPGMGGMDGMGGGFEGIDFSKLGAGADMGLDGGDDDDEDDDEMPALEGDEKATSAATTGAASGSGSKIEEVE